MNNRNEPGAFERRVGGLLKGFKETLPATQEKVAIAGTTTTVANIHQRLASILATQKAVSEAKRVHQNAVAARMAAAASDGAFVDGVVLHLKTRHGDSHEKLAPFGLQPPTKRRSPTMATLVIAQAKARETRRLRQIASGQPPAATLAPSKP